MYGNVLEINESKKFAGRSFIRWIGLKIHESNDDYNRNGITWVREYIQNNIDSAINMPIAVSFMDWEKDEPFDHGFTEVKDGIPLFENSDTVGTTSNAYIDTVEVNGESIQALILEGYIFNQRYPNLLTWLKAKMYDGEAPDTSIEISAKDGNAEIIYDGGWKPEGRKPQIFDFSGSAIITVPPADDSAVLLELNQKSKEDKNMAKSNEELVVELNTKIDTKNTEINQLKDEVKAEKDKVKEVNSNLDAKTTELNSTVDELKDVKKQLTDKESEVETLTSEINELKTFKKEQEDKQLQSELNQALTTYSDEEKTIAKDKIEKFASEPSTELKAEIINEINSEIAKKIIEKRASGKGKTGKDADDIFGDVMDINSDSASSIDELL